MMRANHFLEKYRKIPLGPKDMVKIGILDTGIDLEHPVFKPFIKNLQIHHGFCRNFVKENDPVSDNSGHGTHCAYTILKVCRTARLYVAKVFENDKGDEGSEERTVKVCHSTYTDYIALIKLWRPSDGLQKKRSILS
jgi:hypothetical protein